jgi:hypothetical protein
MTKKDAKQLTTKYVGNTFTISEFNSTTRRYDEVKVKVLELDEKHGLPIAILDNGNWAYVTDLY